MKTDMTINGRTLSTSVLNMLATELFLHDNYHFRRNVLNGKTEFRAMPTDRLASGSLPGEKAEHATLQAPEEEPQEADYRPLTQEALNSIVLRAKREKAGDNPKADITAFVHSEEVPTFNPVQAYLDSLPAWDGRNHVGELFSRLPGISTEQAAFLAIWLRSMVAHWLQMDTLHGNECVPTLIGAQGCGKTTFLRRLLPPQLRQYYLDHLNLSNKFDKEMALTNNLLVNLDELDAIRPSQHAALKQTLSKSRVNGRPIYGAAQEDRPRFASFTATTNNPHPLTDATGSRRYICLTIPQGHYINNVGEIDYDQLYAQVLYELRELKAPYWFNNDEVARIQELNQGYVEQKNMAEMITSCFRKPKEGETPASFTCIQMLEHLRQHYPSLTTTHTSRIFLNKTMRELGFEHTNPKNVVHYKCIPLKAV